MSLFFYSDPHFGHKNVIKYCNRPFSSVEEMDQELIKRYNTIVGPYDHVVWVGDCFFHKKKKACKEILDQLNGTKSLIRGNHDLHPQQMIKMGFSSVQEVSWIKLGNHTVQLCHYPFKPWDFKNLNLSWFNQWFIQRYELRFRNLRPKNNGQFLIHGHTHDKRKFRKNQIHVGVDAWAYAPVSAEEIIEYMDNYRK
jgi:calcineurin-like phosphoesterase family protein